MKRIYLWVALTAVLFSFSCMKFTDEHSFKEGLIDPKATKETVALFRNLKKLSKDHILFGHQHATEYGHGWFGEEGRSDVKSITGSHPAVIGIDFSGLSGRPQEQ